MLKKLNVLQRFVVFAAFFIAIIGFIILKKNNKYKDNSNKWYRIVVLILSLVSLFGYTIFVILGVIDLDWILTKVSPNDYIWAGIAAILSLILPTIGLITALKYKIEYDFYSNDTNATTRFWLDFCLMFFQIAIYSLILGMTSLLSGEEGVLGFLKHFLNGPGFTGVMSTVGILGVVILLSYNTWIGMLRSNAKEYAKIVAKEKLAKEEMAKR